jgi:hypothetical protein
VNRYLDEFLGEPLGTATREDVLKALRGHILGDIILQVEVPGQELPLLHVQGALVEADRNPDTWETAEEFAVIQGGLDPQMWQITPALRAAAGKPDPQDPPHFRVPETGIVEYPGTAWNASGYRFELGGGVTLAVVLWNGVGTVTESGDVAPGLQGFRVEGFHQEEPS